MHLKLRQPRLWQRVSTLMWARRLLWLLVPLALWYSFNQFHCGFCLAVGLFVGVMLVKALGAWEQSLRRQFVRDAQFPRFIIAKLQAAYPSLSASDADLVMRGLRQFFMAHLRSGRKFIAMPSKVVDAAWHEFILHTRGYQAWCNSAFGNLLHHSPAEVLGRNAQRNDGLRRAWYWACKEESIDPRNPSRLPLLFALDRKFDIPGGYRYLTDCGAIRQASNNNSYCGSDFGDSSSISSGDAAGFGGSETSSSGAADGGSEGGSDSGCGGGCGGD